jgi:hypothetical protein
MWRLARAPQQALPMLTELLLPQATLDAQQQQHAQRLLADLDSEEFSARERAEKELAKLGPPVEAMLRKALADRPSLEARRRIETLLEKRVNARTGTLRALETLEHMNTRESMHLLERIANATPRSWLTEEAAASCKRGPSSSRSGFSPNLEK